MQGRAAGKAAEIARLALVGALGIEDNSPELFVWLYHLPKHGPSSLRQVPHKRCKFPLGDPQKLLHISFSYSNTGNNG